RAGLPPHRRGAAVRDHAASEEDPSHQHDHPLSGRMSSRNEALTDAVRERFGARLVHVPSFCGEVTFEVAPADLLEVAAALRDEPAFAFEMLIDLCGVDYLSYGQDEWETVDATRAGFSRAVEPRILA